MPHMHPYIFLQSSHPKRWVSFSNKSDSSASGFLQIVNWRTHLKFPEEASLSSEAKDLISKLLCNVSQRLGSKGADEIKVFVVWCVLV